MQKILLGLMCVLLLGGGWISVSILTEDPLKPGRCFAASREAALGGLWRGLYRDGTFAFGGHERAITARGTYRFQDDTLLLTADAGTRIPGDRPSYRFLLRDTHLEELRRPTDDVRIGFLDVHRTALGGCAPTRSGKPTTAGQANQSAPEQPQTL